MKKFLSVMLALALVCGIFAAFGALQVGATDVKTVSNGDAETGNTQNWDVLFGNGTVENVEYKNTGNHVIKMTPTGHYASAMFDIGPAMIQSAADGYEGAGAGIYTLSFKFKAVETPVSDQYFELDLRSAYWNNAAINPNSGSVRFGTNADGQLSEQVGSWVILRGGRDEWTHVQVSFNVTQTFLDNAVAHKADNGCFIYVRLNGADNRAFKNGNNLFAYYIDDFKIESTPAGAFACAHKLVNGDAQFESTEGWATMSGTIHNVADTDNADNRVITFAPGGVYGTVKFDLGPAIINDADNGYTGGGAGDYRISFRAKAATAGGTFAISLRSFDWNVGVSEIKNLGVCEMTTSWQTFTYDVTVSEDYLSALADAYASNANAYRLYLRLNGADGNAYASELFDYAIDDFKIEKAQEEQQEKKVVNGDAELGTTENWGAMNGSVNNIVDEKNGENHLIRFTPTDKYGCFKFDFGPAIINDADNGYTGGGAGDYHISFRAKAAAGHAGTFKVSLRSFDYNVNAAVINDIGTCEMTEEWGTYTYTVTVTEKYLADLAEAYDANSDAYRLYLRLDGNGNGYAFNETLFEYDIDDVTAEKEQPAEPQKMQVVNGNAEDGTTDGWDAFGGGSQVENVVLENNHVIKFTPADKWGSVKYYVGAAIVQDDSMKENADWYAGNGAGTYTLTFRAKAENSGAETRFYVSLDSDAYCGSASEVQNNTGGLYTGELTRTALGAKEKYINLTDQWQTYTVTFEVTQDYLSLIKALYANGKADAYKLFLRLDGSQTEPFKSNPFVYYVDDAALSVEGKPVNDGDTVLYAELAAIAAVVLLSVVVIVRKKREA